MADAPLHLEQFLPYRLNVLAETVSQSLSRLYQKRYGLSIPEWRVLATLGQYDSMTAKQIGQHSHMHKTKVSRAVTALECRGFIARSVNADDNRESFLSLTTSGRQTYEAVAPEALAFETALLDTLDTDTRTVLDDLLSSLTERAETLASRKDRA